MSDTPRVDAMESAFQESGMYGTFAPVALCRQFEREITTLRQQLSAYREALENLLEAENCPNCPDRGWYAVQQDGVLTQEQCRWCYAQENSVFSRRLEAVALTGDTK
jgi:hypothetical protein